MSHQIETYTLRFACGHTDERQVEHWGDQPYGDQTTAALCAGCQAKRDRKHARILRQYGAAIEKISSAAHPLCEAVQTSDGQRVVAGCTYTPYDLECRLNSGESLPPATHDYMGRPTDGRITHAEAVAEYGAEAVNAALEVGRVYVDADGRLMASGVTIG